MFFLNQLDCCKIRHHLYTLYNCIFPICACALKLINQTILSTYYFIILYSIIKNIKNPVTYKTLFINVLRHPTTTRHYVTSRFPKPHVLYNLKKTLSATLRYISIPESRSCSSLRIRIFRNPAIIRGLWVIS